VKDPRKVYRLPKGVRTYFTDSLVLTTKGLKKQKVCWGSNSQKTAKTERGHPPFKGNKKALTSTLSLAEKGKIMSHTRQKRDKKEKKGSQKGGR